MSQKSSAPTGRVPAEKLVHDIRRATRKHHSAEDKTRCCCRKSSECIRPISSTLLSI
jgi:hypothetical protein